MSWLISIVGVVFLGVMVDIITPEGKTNNFIKSIFAIIVFYIIVTPIINLFDSEHSWAIEDVALQDSYLESVSGTKIDTLEIELQKLIMDKGYECFVEIDGSMYGNSISINNITVFLPDNVLNEGDKHINNCKVITQLIKEKVGVEEDEITYERM